MTDLRTAAQQALFALQYHVEMTWPVDRTSEAIFNLRAALAEPAPEPAFHGFMSADGTRVDLCFSPGAPRSDGIYATAYYTAPPQQPAPEPEHKPQCALLQIPSRECDCMVEPAPEQAHGIKE